MGIKYVFASSKKSKVLYVNKKNPNIKRFLQFEDNPNYPDYFVYITEDDEEANFLQGHMSDVAIKTKGQTGKKVVTKQHAFPTFKWVNQETYEMQKMNLEMEAKMAKMQLEKDALSEIASRELKSEGLSDEEVADKIESAAKDKELADIKGLLRSDKYQEVAEKFEIPVKFSWGIDKLKSKVDEIESHFDD